MRLASVAARRRCQPLRWRCTIARLMASTRTRSPKDLTARHLPFARVPDTHMETGWPHLANMLYTSAYYTYLWSRVIAKDLSTQFDKSDLLAPAPARRYREVFLAQGSVKPAEALIQDFPGRPFRIDAWGRWLNAETALPSVPR